MATVLQESFAMAPLEVADVAAIAEQAAVLEAAAMTRAESLWDLLTTEATRVFESLMLRIAFCTPSLKNFAEIPRIPVIS